jgi:protocatechuate 3,4-dioxygenase beta subunit
MPTTPVPAGQPPAAAQKAPAEREERIEVNGTVLNAEGKPVQGAKVLVWTKGVGSRANMPVRARTAADGTFRFSLWEEEVFQGAQVIADGRAGVDWKAVGNAKQGRDLTLLLRPDDTPLTGRILDLEGRPVAGVHLEILSVGQTEGDVGKWIDAFVRIWKQGSWAGWSGLTSVPAEALGLKAPVTDKEGRFRLDGVGRDRVVTLLTRGEKVEALQFQAVARPGPKAGWKPGYLGLSPAGGEVVVGPTKPIVGTVRERRTGKPAAGVIVACITQKTRDLEAITDEHGRYRIVGAPKLDSYTLSVAGKKGHPYLDHTVFDVPGTPGLVPLEVDLTVERGVEITGRVLSRDGRTPVRARVSYHDLPDNPHVKEFATLKGFKHLVSDWGRVGPDGRFCVVGIPGRGLLIVNAEDRRRFAQVDTWKEMSSKLNINPVREANAVVVINAKASGGPVDIGDILLEPAVELTGTVLDPDGKPLAGVIAAGLRDRSALVAEPVKGRDDLKQVQVLKAATFTARARGKGDATALVFYHPTKNLTCIYRPGQNDTRSVQVRLQPCGTVTGRVVDDRGAPLAGYKVHVQCRMWDESVEKLDLPKHELNETGLSRLLQQQRTTDEKGQFRVEGLFPGLPYELFVLEPGGERGFYHAKTLDFASGKVRDLGDLKRNLFPHKDAK